MSSRTGSEIQVFATAFAPNAVRLLDRFLQGPRPVSRTLLEIVLLFLYIEVYP